MEFFLSYKVSQLLSAPFYIDVLMHIYCLIYGYEVLAMYNMSDEVDITATYAWVEGKDTANDIYLGAQQISAPKGTINVNWRPLDNTHLSLTYLYVGDRKKFSPENGVYVGTNGPVDSYHIFNVSGNYVINRDWSAFIGVENLFNQDYYPSKSQAYTYSGYNVKGLGTTVNLGASYQF